MATFSHYSTLATLLLILSLFLFLSDAIIVKNFTQPLNHFGVSNVTFQQRYVINDRYWAGADKNTPILVFFGGEAHIMAYAGHIGVMNDAASRLQALTVYIEHRFYGKSVPFASIKKALASQEVRSFLTSEQALADFAGLIISLKQNLSAIQSPVIVFGTSYGGMLATWFRIKYPNIAIGALASSAPILLFDKVLPKNDFCSILSKDFETVNKTCFETIRRSWNTIDEIASQEFGLGVLTKAFNLCRTPLSTLELKRFLAHMYLYVAEYNGQHNDGINIACDTILKMSTGLMGIVALVTDRYANVQSCVDMNISGVTLYDDPYNYDTMAWNWQLCSEIIIRKRCIGNDSLLVPQEAIDDQSEHIENCLKRYATLPRPNLTSTFHGGLDMIKVGSNIIFSNGLMDPYSSLGILEDLSSSIKAVNTKQGSCCLDMYSPRKDDPRWLVDQRNKEIDILIGWIHSGAPKIPITIFYLFILLVYIF